MSHAGRPARGRSSGTKDKGKTCVNKRAGIEGLKQRKETRVANAFGVGIIVVLVLCLALLFMTRHGSNTVSVSGSGSTADGSAGYGSLDHPKGPCGNTGQAACAPVDPGWFSVVSQSPGDVAAAISNSENFVAMQGRFGYVAVDTPALVHAYNAHTGIAYYDNDHWVVSVRNTSGLRCGIFDFVYDGAHQRMRFSSYGMITAMDPHAQLAFPYISSSVALARLRSQRQLSIMAGTSAELIFFPIDPGFPDLSSPVHKWAGGGNSPMNPMWHIVGSDGRDYFVGADLNVHTQSDLPIARGEP